MSRQVSQIKTVDQSTNDKCLACAVAEGDIVNFRFLFMPASPLRPDSPEEVNTPKYAYLFPVDESDRQYQDALRLVQRGDIGRYVRTQLEKKGPPQLPWELVMALADNAVRLGKHTAASQAYELLRIRRRMQEIVLEKSDARLAERDIEASVKGYLIASGLDYDYAAFPEPMPTVPNYQERALALHGVYPSSADKALAMQPDETILKTALTFLLSNAEFSRRQSAFPEEVKIDFITTLIRRMDAGWEEFVERYKQAEKIVERHQSLLDRINSYSAEALELLFEQLLDSAQMEELRQIPGILLGMPADDWDWWQCMKTLSYHHPGAALFIARQRLSAKEEILVPRHRPDSVLARKLGLLKGLPQQ